MYFSIYACTDSRRRGSIIKIVGIIPPNTLRCFGAQSRTSKREKVIYLSLLRTLHKGSKDSKEHSKNPWSPNSRASMWAVPVLGAVPRVGSDGSWRWLRCSIKLLTAQRNQWFPVRCRPQAKIVKHNFTAILALAAERKLEQKRRLMSMPYRMNLWAYVWHSLRTPKYLGELLWGRGPTI